MSTGLIIAIVVAAIILVALLVLLPRMRDKARVKARERELNQRREHVAGEHRDAAEHREREAEIAEREARMAEKEAERRRAEAELHQERADLHQRGMADHELVEEHERDKFADASPGVARTEEEEQSGRFTPGTGPATCARAADQVPPAGERPPR
jgi:FtsZ-interacting cell division protein ZipA